MRNDEYLNVHEQIKYLKERNLKFNIISEKKAKEILLNQTYFHKLINYKHIISTFSSEEVDNFNGMEFSDLYELKLIDNILRESFNDVTLEIENYFKVLILRHVDSKPEKCDHFFYYDIIDVDRIYRINNRMKKRIKDYDDYYSKKYLRKFPDEKPIWVLNEYLSFGEVLEIFIKYVHKERLREYDSLIYYLKRAKLIRNITAHNNTLYMRSDALKDDVKELQLDLNIHTGLTIKPKYITGNFTNKLVSTILLYKMLVPSEVYEQRMNKIFFEIHTMVKTYQIFKRYPEEKAIKEVKYLYYMINKLY